MPHLSSTMIMLLGKGVWHGEIVVSYAGSSVGLFWACSSSAWCFSRTCFADVMARVAQSNDCIPDRACVGRSESAAIPAAECCLKERRTAPLFKDAQP